MGRPIAEQETGGRQSLGLTVTFSGIDLADFVLAAPFSGHIESGFGHAGFN